MMWFVDMMPSFPTFFLIPTVEAVTNNFSIVIMFRDRYVVDGRLAARADRSLSLRERDSCRPRSLGAAPSWRHLLLTLAPVIVAATLYVGDNILRGRSLIAFRRADPRQLGNV